MSSGPSDEEKRELVSIVGQDIESTAAMVIGGFGVDEFAVANVMTVEDQYYHISLQIQPISEEKAEEIKDSIQQASQHRGEAPE